MGRGTLDVIDNASAQVVTAGGLNVITDAWGYIDFPVRGGWAWNKYEPGRPTDSNDYPDYLLIKQTYELWEAVYRRAKLISAPTGNLPNHVDLDAKPDYHWVVSMQAALEDIFDTGVYELTTGVVATKANVLPLVHAAMSKRDTGTYTYGGLNHDNADWLLIGPDTDGDAWVYGNPSGTGYEQINELWRMRLDNTSTDTAGISYMKLVDRGGGDFRWEFYAAAARTVLKGYTDDFSATSVVVVRTSGGTAAGFVRAIKPAGGWATTATVTAQVPDKRVVWAQQINEIYYTCEHLCMIEIDSSASYNGGGDSKSGAGYNYATSEGAYGAAWNAFNAASYSGGSQTSALKSCNVSNPSLWDCYVSNARANAMSYTLAAQEYDTYKMGFQWGTGGDMGGESLSVGLTLLIDGRAPSYGGENGVATIGISANDEDVDLSAYYDDDYIGDAGQVSYYYKEAEFKSQIWASFAFDGYYNGAYDPLA